MPQHRMLLCRLLNAVWWNICVLFNGNERNYYGCFHLFFILQVCITLTINWIPHRIDLSNWTGICISSHETITLCLSFNKRIVEHTNKTADFAVDLKLTLWWRHLSIGYCTDGGKHVEKHPIQYCRNDKPKKLTSIRHHLTVRCVCDCVSWLFSLNGWHKHSHTLTLSMGFLFINDMVLHHYKRTTGKYLYFQWCVFVHGFVNSVTGYRNLCVFPSMKSSIGLSSYATAVIIGSKKLSKKFTSFDVESEKSQQSIAVFFCSSSSSIDKKRLQTPTHTYGDSLINRVYILN